MNTRDKLKAWVRNCCICTFELRLKIIDQFIYNWFKVIGRIVDHIFAGIFVSEAIYIPFGNFPSV